MTTIIKKFDCRYILLICVQVTFFYSNADDTHFGKIATTITEVFTKSGIEITAKKMWNTHYLHGYTDNPFVKLVADTYQDTRSEFSVLLL